MYKRNQYAHFSRAIGYINKQEQKLIYSNGRWLTADGC